MLSTCRRVLLRTAARRWVGTGQRLQSSVAAPSRRTRKRGVVPKAGKSLADFMREARDAAPGVHEPPQDLSAMNMQSSDPAEMFGERPSYFIETYGCQMNVSDSEIVHGILQSRGYELADDATSADVILLNTCAIRENAEQRVWGRLAHFRGMKKRHKRYGVERPPVLGVLGCMAERLKTKLLEQEKAVDLIAGPDAYRDLPNLIAMVQGTNESAMNVQLSQDETYADLAPVRSSESQTHAFVSIMRGCNNMCSFCVVPFTRGRERSRPVQSVVDELRRLQDEGFKEAVLLGQNVNSFHDRNAPSAGKWADAEYQPAPGFRNMYRLRGGPGVRFPELLDVVSDAVPEMRIRFTSPHPKDFPMDLLSLIAEKPNLCTNLHLPAQSGSTDVLMRMRRNYTREAFLDLADRARSTIPNVALSTDIITGFCGETEADHEGTVSLMQQVQFEQAFMFAYSLRGRTHAAYKFEDDVPEEVKQRRLQEVIAAFHEGVEGRYRAELGTRHLVLVEGPSKRWRPDHRIWQGRTDNNKRVFFPESLVAASYPSVVSDAYRDGGRLLPEAQRAALDPIDVAALGSADVRPTPYPSLPSVEIQRGDFLVVDVVGAGMKNLVGLPVARSSVQEFDRIQRQSGRNEQILKE